MASFFQLVLESSSVDIEMDAEVKERTFTLVYTFCEARASIQKVETIVVSVVHRGNYR